MQNILFHLLKYWIPTAERNLLLILDYNNLYLKSTPIKNHDNQIVKIIWVYMVWNLNMNVAMLYGLSPGASFFNSY